MRVCRCIGWIYVAGGLLLVAIGFLLANQSHNTRAWETPLSAFALQADLPPANGQDLIPTTLAEACLSCHEARPPQPASVVVNTSMSAALLDRQFEERFSTVGNYLLAGYTHHPRYTSVIREFWSIHRHYRNVHPDPQQTLALLADLKQLEQQIIRLNYELHSGKYEVAWAPAIHPQVIGLQQTTPRLPLYNQFCNPTLSPSSEYQWLLVEADIPALHHCFITHTLRGPPAATLLVIDFVVAKRRLPSMCTDEQAPFCFALSRNLARGVCSLPPVNNL